jgi:hypothetical protein
MDFTITREKRTIFESIIESLIFSFFIYSIVAFFINKYPVFIEIVESGVSKQTYFRYNNSAFLIVIIVSIALPLILSFVCRYDLIMKLLRVLKITNKTSRKTTWNDAFLDGDTHVIINFSNGRRIYGWPKYYSEDPEKPLIYLHKPSWVEKDEFIDLDINGTLITEKQAIESIEFLKT